jgi:hypothetical protein
MKQRLSIGFLALAGAILVGLRAPPAARAAPVVGPALQVDGPVLAGAPGDQTVPAAAHADGQFVVVWRTALWEGEVRAARVTATGEVRDPRGVPLPGLEGIDATLGVAAGAGHVLVVGTAEGKLLALPLAGGTAADVPLVPGAPVLLATAPVGQALGRPVVAWNGASFWVLWSQSGAGVLALRVGADGLPLDPAPLLLSPLPGHPALASDGQRTLAAWSAALGGRVVVQARRLDSEGQAIDAQALPLGELAGARPGPTAVAWSGSHFLVAASGEDGVGGAAAIGAMRVTAAGQVLDPAPLALAQLAAAPEGGPTVIWNGSRFVVLWSESSGPPGGNLAATSVVWPEGRLVGLDGNVSALGLPGLGATGAQPVAVTSPGQGLVFLARAAGGRRDLDIRGVRLGMEGGAVGGDFLVSGGLVWQGKPALAVGGGGGQRRLLLAWEDARHDRFGGDIRAALLDRTGAPTEPVSLPLATGLAAQHAPAVAWDGRGFQAIWHERGRGLMAARVGLDGKVIDRPPLLVPGTGGREVLSDPALCGDDSGALLVWSARRVPGAGGPPQAELRAVRIAPGGSVKEGQSLPLLTTHDVSVPPAMRLACAADGALLIWAGLFESDRSDLPDLHFALIPRQGEADAPRVTLLERRTGDEGPALATDGRGFLVAWRPRQMNGARVTIVGTRVDAAGTGLDMPARELGSLNAGHRVSAYWDGEQYLLVGIQMLGTDDFQLRGRGLGADLRAPDAEWFPIDRVSSRRGTGTLPITMGLHGGAGLVAYETFADDDATGNQRLHVRLLGTPPLDVPDGGATGDAPSDTRSGDDDDTRAARSRGGGCDCAVEGAPPSASRWPWLALALLAGRRLGKRRSACARRRAQRMQ